MRYVRRARGGGGARMLRETRKGEAVGVRAFFFWPSFGFTRGRGLTLAHLFLRWKRVTSFHIIERLFGKHKLMLQVWLVFGGLCASPFGFRVQRKYWLLLYLYCVFARPGIGM